MSSSKRLLRIALLPWFGALLLATTGCGGNSTGPLEPDGGEKLKQARINALGPAGIDTTKRSGSSSPVINSQAAARQKAQSGQ